MWLQELENFERSARQAFDFLHTEKDYLEPFTEFGRDFVVIYASPVEATRITIGWERSWFVPIIFIERSYPGTTELEHIAPQDILPRLNVMVDSTSFPNCAKIVRRTTPGPQELWIHWRRKQEIVAEYPHFLNEHSRVLRLNYDHVVAQVHSR